MSEKNKGGRRQKRVSWEPYVYTSSPADTTHHPTNTQPPHDPPDHLGSKPVDAELVDKVFDAAAKNGPAGQPGVAFDQLMPSIKKFAAYVR